MTLCAGARDGVKSYAASPDYLSVTDRIGVERTRTGFGAGAGRLRTLTGGGGSVMTLAVFRRGVMGSCSRETLGLAAGEG